MDFLLIIQQSLSSLNFILSHVNIAFGCLIIFSISSIVLSYCHSGCRSYPHLFFNCLSRNYLCYFVLGLRIGNIFFFIVNCLLLLPFLLQLRCAISLFTPFMFIIGNIIFMFIIVGCFYQNVLVSGKLFNVIIKMYVVYYLMILFVYLLCIFSYISLNSIVLLYVGLVKLNVFSYYLVLAISLIAFLIICNSINYLSYVESFYFVLLLLCFYFIMYMFVVSFNILMLFICWEYLGLVSYLLINY